MDILRWLYSALNRAAGKIKLFCNRISTVQLVEYRFKTNKQKKTNKSNFHKFLNRNGLLLCSNSENSNGCFKICPNMVMFSPVVLAYRIFVKKQKQNTNCNSQLAYQASQSSEVIFIQLGATAYGSRIMFKDKCLFQKTIMNILSYG